MAAKKSNSAMEFLLAHLKSNKKATYAECKEAAAKKKLEIWPIMYGRAQAMLGIVKQAPRGQGKAAKAKQAKEAGVVKRGPGRPRKNAAPAMAIDGSLESIVAAVKSSEAAKNRYRQALERIQEVLANALAD